MREPDWCHLVNFLTISFTYEVLVSSVFLIWRNIWWENLSISWDVCSCKKNYSSHSGVSNKYTYFYNIKISPKARSQNLDSFGGLVEQLTSDRALYVTTWLSSQ